VEVPTIIQIGFGMVFISFMSFIAGIVFAVRKMDN
jgi:hypothetical protein